MSARYAPLLLILLIFLCAKTNAFNVYHLGGTDGHPWPTALSYEPGDYRVLNPDGTTGQRLPVAAPSAHPTWEDTLGERIDSVGGQWLRPFFVPDTLNLAQDGIRGRYDNDFFVDGNLFTSGESYDVESQTRLMRPAVDGDPQTASFYTASASSDPTIRRGIYIQNNVVDLGVNYPVNRIRFFPRLGTNNPKIDAILAAMAPPKLRKEDLLEEDFSANFMPWFELAAANSEQNLGPFTGGWLRSIIPGIPNAKSDSRFTVLFADRENLDVVMDFRFPTQQLRWIAYRVLDPIRNYEIAEFQVFGSGYVQRAIYTTAVLDFGQPMAWGNIRWKGTRDPQAQLLIRTRTGHDDEPLLYWQKTSIPGEYKQVTRKEYDITPKRERRLTLDEQNWSFWSAPYAWQAGLADTTLTASAWQDGTPILSPGPARYLQLQLLFLSTQTAAAKLRELEIQFSPPAALRAVGEIWPLDVSRTESTSFTYSVLPTFDRDTQGFDRLEIFTLTRADTVRSVRVDGVEVSDQFPPQIQADRLMIALPRLQGGDDTFKLVEVEFDARVVRYGTEFQGWIFDSEGTGVKQLIEPGDATVDFPGNALGVRPAGLGDELLTQVSVFPNPFTPNGDGLNDVARFQFQLHEVSAPRDLRLRVYDVSGRLVRQLDRQWAIRGLFGQGVEDPVWDGLDEEGGLVAPGIYLYRISLDTDEGTEEKLGAISVAY